MLDRDDTGGSDMTGDSDTVHVVDVPAEARFVVRIDGALIGNRDPLLRRRRIAR